MSFYELINEKQLPANLFIPLAQDVPHSKQQLVLEYIVFIE